MSNRKEFCRNFRKKQIYNYSHYVQTVYYMGIQKNNGLEHEAALQMTYWYKYWYSTKYGRDNYADKVDIQCLINGFTNVLKRYGELLK